MDPAAARLLSEKEFRKQGVQSEPRDLANTDVLRKHNRHSENTDELRKHRCLTFNPANTARSPWGRGNPQAALSSAPPLPPWAALKVSICLSPKQQVSRRKMNSQPSTLSAWKYTWIACVSIPARRLVRIAVGAACAVGHLFTTGLL